MEPLFWSIGIAATIYLAFNLRSKNKNKLEDFPMLPVRIFKKFDLKSVSEDKIVKKLVSSGTSGQELSKIYLDKKNHHHLEKLPNHRLKHVTPYFYNLQYLNYFHCRYIFFKNFTICISV